ncbi:hypothetical protein [Kordiimonas laminariae]|uniref:hypothetical protein n=1 Tax=Kordiimonas laminariae TaxID=2917717 RepID=UPI001FF4EEDD|nr:hypothetical protein [Kordiimonas laminariae]MCK0069410.1 hypothetical protein [Kordiimonas laminariae]
MKNYTSQIEQEKWITAERQFIEDEIKWFKIGAKIFSPGGKDISATKLEQLEKRLEHLRNILGEQ